MNKTSTELLSDLILGGKKPKDLKGSQCLIITVNKIATEPKHQCFDDNGNLVDIDAIEANLQQVRDNGGVAFLEQKHYPSWARFINEKEGLL